MNRGTGRILIFLVFTRVLVFVLPWLTITLLFPENSPLNFLEFTKISWNRWDAPHYLYLAQNWYTNIGDAANFVVFFPLYPLLIKGLVLVFGNPALTAVVTSTLLFIAGGVVFYKLLLLDYPEKIARWAILALAIFPTSYFFNSPYTESLFLLVFSLSFYFARKEKWIWAGIACALAVITRPSGLVLLPAILVEWFLAKKRHWRFLPVIVFPSVLAMGVYLAINKNIYGDFFAFQKILSSHWQKYLVSPFTGIVDSWRIAFSGGLTNFTILVGWAEAISTSIAWLLIPFALKLLRKSWAVFYILSVVLITSTSFVLSTPRYFLSIPPIFILIALAEKNSIFRTLWRFTSIALLFCLSIIFTRGQWAF